ncbi:MAG: DUF4917 family protein [Nitrososphaerales archaeon]
MPNIADWSDIAGDFREGLILGNGASIALHKGFAYQSLLEQARRRQFITRNVESIFNHLHTKDFERVLRMLWHTSRINKALKIKDTRTQKAYKSLRTALVRTVTTIHAAHTRVCDKLPQIAMFMKRFEIVVSLNYDLLVYWAMLWENRRHQNRFKDCFVHGEFDSDWEHYREPYGNARRSTLVFYPHGNLALARDQDGREKKLTASAFSNLLETVTSEWSSGEYTPLFVSEGTSTQKVATINRSHYLKTVHDSVLPKLGKRVAIFGWSLSQSDKHILRAICRGNLAEVAVSVLTSKPNVEDKCAEIKRKIKDASNSQSVKVVFFEANSQGCWLNA